MSHDVDLRRTTAVVYSEGMAPIVAGGSMTCWLPTWHECGPPRLRVRNIARLQDCKIAGLQDRRIVRLQYCGIARLRDCKDRKIAR